MITLRYWNQSLSRKSPIHDWATCWAFLFGKVIALKGGTSHGRWLQEVNAAKARHCGPISMASGKSLALGLWHIRFYPYVCIYIYISKHLHMYMNMYSWRRTQGPWGQENAEAQEAASTTMVRPGPVEASEHQIISDCWYTSNYIVHTRRINDLCRKKDNLF